MGHTSTLEPANAIRFVARKSASDILPTISLLVLARFVRQSNRPARNVIYVRHENDGENNEQRAGA